MKKQIVASDYIASVWANKRERERENGPGDSAQKNRRWNAMDGWMKEREKAYSEFLYRLRKDRAHRYIHILVNSYFMWVKR